MQSHKMDENQPSKNKGLSQKVDAVQRGRRRERGGLTDCRTRTDVDLVLSRLKCLSLIRNDGRTDCRIILKGERKAGDCVRAYLNIRAPEERRGRFLPLRRFDLERVLAAPSKSDLG